MFHHFTEDITGVPIGYNSVHTNVLWKVFQVKGTQDVLIDLCVQEMKTRISSQGKGQKVINAFVM